jgi:hypothetical protein
MQDVQCGNPATKRTLSPPLDGEGRDVNPRARRAIRAPERLKHWNADLPIGVFLACFWHFSATSRLGDRRSKPRERGTPYINPRATGAYSRRGAEDWAVGGDGEQDAPSVFCGHQGDEIGRGFVRGLGLMAAPFQKQTIDQARENAMHPHSVAVSQAALIVAPGDVQSGVQPVLNTSVLPVERQAASRAQLLGRQAGDQRHGLGLVSVHFAAQPRGLGGERKAGGLGRNGSGAKRAGLGAALVAFVGAGQRR